jgi:hypothetical protein
MQTVHLTYYVVVLIWILIIEGLGIYWHVLRISQKVSKVLAALEKSHAEH